MKEKLGFKKGANQGDMNPMVESYQKPESNYSQSGFSKTTDYIERQDAFVGKESAEFRKQDYKGRYS